MPISVLLLRSSSTAGKLGGATLLGLCALPISARRTAGAAEAARAALPRCGAHTAAVPAPERALRPAARGNKGWGEWARFWTADEIVC